MVKMSTQKNEWTIRSTGHVCGLSFPGIPIRGKGTPNPGPCKLTHFKGQTLFLDNALGQCACFSFLGGCYTLHLVDLS